MKKLTLTLFMLLGLGANIVAIQAQDLKGKKNALASHTVVVSTELMEKAAYPGDLVSTTTKKNVSDAKDILTKTLTDQAYAYITQQLKEKHNIELLPKNTMSDVLHMDKHGYPHAFLKRAAKKGNSDFYVSITVSVSNLTTIGLGDVVGLEKWQIKPSAETTIVIADEKGKRVNKASGKAKVAKPLKIKELGLKEFSVITESGRTILAKPLTQLIEEASLNAINDLTIK